ncbi:hypothetical protein POM88_013742 [Heracleum sosnowskyi]|uniref:ATP-dependent DNA helicase n=1 Tax=Heracleum sosnowskyi TaxID=360622 RepID=A0AAD8IZQ5_9APIA|nr:hypothetical protein POM88_013742 [Heracleum sosnowskyi]
METPSRKRGRPRIVVTEAVAEVRRLAVQQRNARRAGGDGEPSRKRGRPRIVVTEAVAETRRLAVQQRNARRAAGDVVAGYLPFHFGTCYTFSVASCVVIFPVMLQARVGAHPVLRWVVQPVCRLWLGSTKGEVGVIHTVSALDSPRRRNHIDRGKASFASGVATHDIGMPDQVCGYCTAQVWAAEFTGRHVGSGPKGYSICCGKGKVHLPLLSETPPELMALLTGNGSRERKFKQNNRMYNTIFALCSFGGTVDEAINNGSAPYVFRVNLQTYHSIGSLLPPDGRTPKFAQFYMYDGQEALDYRLGFPQRRNVLDAEIVGILQEMLFRVNALVQIFRQVRERYPLSQQIPVRLRLLERRSGDGRFVNLPGGNDYEFAGLAIDDNFVDTRDILVDYKQSGLKHINELHPCFMSLQYPLLFPAGEDGFRLGIKHRGYRYMQQNFQDSIAVCKEYGHPDIFITFTCNPKWVEIQRAVAAAGSQDASVRPDLVARVFKIKLDAMMADLTKQNVLGRVLAVVYTIEFQKRGLPHAHIVLWMAEGDKLMSTDDIDTIISAELPDKEIDAVGYEAVSQFMMHDPCGEANPKCPCMVNGNCTKYYPKPYTPCTTFDTDGYALYRRRNTGMVVERNKIHLDNRHVVPYNRGLLVKYQAHINVERQVLPVLPKEGREVIVGASISKSYLWQSCTVYQLFENMRLEEQTPPITLNGESMNFRDWILRLGDGTEPTYALDDDIEPTWIPIPKEACQLLPYP